MIQKIRYIERGCTETINNLYLEKGWKVVSLHPVSTHTERTTEFGAYVVLEKAFPNIPEYPM